MYMPDYRKHYSPEALYNLYKQFDPQILLKNAENNKSDFPRTCTLAESEGKNPDNVPPYTHEQGNSQIWIHKLCPQN